MHIMGFTQMSLLLHIAGISKDEIIGFHSHRFRSQSIHNWQAVRINDRTLLFHGEN